MKIISSLKLLHTPGNVTLPQFSVVWAHPECRLLLCHVEDCCDTGAIAARPLPAGMQNVDTEKVKKVVYDISKDSVHFQNEQRKQV